MFKQRIYRQLDDQHVTLFLKSAQLNSDDSILDIELSYKDLINEISKKDLINNGFKLAEALLIAFHPYCYRCEIKKHTQVFVYEK